MKNFIFLKPTAIIFLLCGILVSACTAPEENTAAPSPAVAVEKEQLPIETPANIPPEPIGWQVELVAENLDIPWSVVFPDEERILVGERSGRIRQIVDGTLIEEPIYQFSEVTQQGESGLMGLALDPDYENNGYLYACYATQTSVGLIDRVARLVDSGGAISMDAIILDNIPAAQFHAGCRLQFGTDGKLYVTTGDALEKQLAQDTESMVGKILRINADGTIPVDNPLAGSAVFSFGHRNPQGISWDMKNGIMYSSEHGPSGFDGPGGGDEINIILAGGNYGWPLVSHDKTLDGTIQPIIQFTPAEAPASLLFYQAEGLPFFKGNLFFGALRGEGVVRIILSEDGRHVIKTEKIVDDVGRVRDVTAGPDGMIYFTTSNRDGRGSVRDGDDKLFRIVPVFQD